MRMKYLPIDNSLFIKNRENFIKQLKPNSLAVFNSNDIMPTNADGVMPFRQNSNLLYLSGIDQEESILVIYPDAPHEEYRQILFLKETSPEIAIWEGHKLTKEEAASISGVSTVYWLSDFERIFHMLAGHCEYIYLNSNEHNQAAAEVTSRDVRFIQWCQQKYPLHTYRRTHPLVSCLRMIKTPIEVDLIQQACTITEKGFRRILSFVKPGVTEYEIEAEYSHEFLRNRSRGFAYEPIIASGFSSCVLHYIENNKVCKDGDVLLMDVGAEYANYAADMTRVIPVNGRFTSRQKAVYKAVLRVMKEAQNMLLQGNLLEEYQKAVGECMEKELIDLGLLNLKEVQQQDPKKPLYKKYFMHGTSHFLGLDVHDVGSRYRKFEPGMVFTCEPGIYIREENIGIRLENDILITEEGNKDLMGTIPLEAEEIEELMNT